MPLLRAKGKFIFATEKNTDALLVASKKVGLKINAEKTECSFKSRQQNAEKN
jgi:hypothetical protein